MKTVSIRYSSEDTWLKLHDGNVEGLRLDKNGASILTNSGWVVQISKGRMMIFASPAHGVPFCEFALPKAQRAAQDNIDVMTFAMSASEYKSRKEASAKLMQQA